MISTIAVVLAAGKGTRMKSDLPKVLVPVAGRPMIDYVLDALASAGVPNTIVVIGYRGDLVRETLARRQGISFVEQTEQLGTGHAVMACREALSSHDGAVLVVTGDSPLMQTSSIEALLTEFDRTHPACLLGTAHRSEPAGLGRILRDGEGQFRGIVEERDASPDKRRITEVNMSCYVFDCRELLGALGKIGRHNAQGEYYITDCPGIMLNEGKRVEALPVLQPCEALSINTVDELAVVETELIKLRGSAAART
jgi:bifunctional UDP-N-acetylglucosamine pyrophosphorylase/glucosamine-1-phosphate N-acetyltransferase/UDP-N-acetylglucosamine pyrophosphorylase